MSCQKFNYPNYLSLLGNLKSNEETRQTGLHPYPFDPRAYQAVSTSTAGVANSYAVYSSTDMRQNNRSSPSQPQRPNHLGEKFFFLNCINIIYYYPFWAV